ncbi:MAG: serine hydrolase [Phycisphaerae bacterium]|nr:serine hydrolase [Phycisphaerae bacterium]
MPIFARIATVVLAMQVVSGVLVAQQTQQLVTVLEAKIPQLMEAEHVPGLSMVLIRDGRIAWKGVFGVRTAGKPEKVDDETVFEAASMSKPVFSYAVLKLVEEGRFDLDRPLDSYLPEPYLPDQPLAKQITGRMVLLHRTGLPNWREGGWRKGGPLKVLHEPGTRFTYSGEGYTYLQTVIAHLTGQSVDVWMDQALLGPLNMMRSSYVWRPSLENNYAGGHDKDGNLKPSRRFYDLGNAAFSLYTTPTDYALFLIEMMKPDRSAPHSLKAETLEGMTTLQVQPEEGDDQSRRSLGWVIARGPVAPGWGKNTPAGGGATWVCHSGSNGTGFRCTCRFDPKRQSGCVIMTNSDSGVKVWESILAMIDSMAPENKPQIAAGRETTWGPIQRTIKYEYRVMNTTSKAAGKIDVFVPLPLESPRQEIRYLHLSERGQQRVFTDVHGQKLAHYSFDSLEPGGWIDLGFVVGITLRNMRWNAGLPADANAPVLTPEQRQRYLKPETNYSMDDESMRRIAADLTRDATSDLDKLTRIHDYIIGKIRYVRDNTWDPAAAVLARGTGSCSEYNYVLCGLCRLAGLPTRSVGGTSSGFRDLPTTDCVFHRWTEVFLTGYGWFPADCSRDANPIRGKRSHFGRVYHDAMIWCRQAGGEDDSLGWEYRAKLRVEGDDPGLQEDHRTRWFEFQPDEQVEAAYAWFLDGGQTAPPADLLECALLRWEKAGADNRLKMIRALAASGRNECLRRAATLPEADGLRETCMRELCDSAELATVALENSRQLFRFRSWFRSNEADLLATGDGRFKLAKKTQKSQTPVTTARSSQIWTDLAAEVVDRLADSVPVGEGKTVVVMPLEDQTLAGLGDTRVSLHETLEDLISRKMAVTLLDEVRFDQLMQEQGPGSREYWALANGDCGNMAAEMVPEVILVPLCITERPDKEKQTVLYHLELKGLELSSRRYTQVIARRNRRAEGDEAASDRGVLVAGGDTVLARWEHDLVARNGYDWPLAGVASVLSAADAALCNLECCVSLRGSPADKGERCPFYYRARPEMLRCLTGAGIDIVTAANNHAGDYGPLSVADTAMWCDKAGLVCVGIGTCGTPVAPPPSGVSFPQPGAAGLLWYPRPRGCSFVGPVSVALVGMDTTMPHSRVRQDRPGTNYVDEDDLRAFEDQMQSLGQWAQGRCDLLVLTIHWGDNWVRDTPPVHREMARIAFEHGVDLILGHSAHRLQGIELMDGKPVVYDMGNLLFDCELQPEGRRSALFRLHLSPKGVHRIEVIPALALEGHTVLARSPEANGILVEMRDLCSALGTNLVVEEDIEGRPVGVIDLPEPRATWPSRPRLGKDHVAQPPSAGETPCSPAAPGWGKNTPEGGGATDLLTFSPSISDAVLVSEVPEDARRVTPPAELAPKVELLASRLPQSAVEGGILRVSTWWRVAGEIPPNVMLALQLSVEGQTPRRGTPWYTRHDPGDWTAPLSRLKPGQIVEDNYPARLAGLPAGTCKVYAVVIDTCGTPVAPPPSGVSFPQPGAAGLHVPSPAGGGWATILGEPCLLGEVQITPRTDK